MMPRPPRYIDTPPSASWRLPDRCGGCVCGDVVVWAAGAMTSPEFPVRPAAPASRIPFPVPIVPLVPKRCSRELLRLTRDQVPLSSFRGYRLHPTRGD